MAGLRETTAAEQQEGAGYLVGDEVCALFAGALTFREQCVAAGILYKDLDSEGDSTTDDGGGKSMMLVEDEEAEEDGRDVCAHVCSHNDRCEVCDDGGEALLPCDYCNLAYHTGCLAPPLIIAEGEDVAFACPLCVAGRRAGHEDTGVVAVGAPDAAVEAEARRARDEAVRREHAAIEGYRREHSDAALTRATITTCGEPIIVDGAVGGDPPGRRRRQAEEPAVVETAEPPPRRRRRRRAAGARGESPSKGARGGAPGGSSKHEYHNMRDARARLAKRMAALRARRDAHLCILPTR